MTPPSLRPWNQTELQTLFGEFFSPSPTACPVCGAEVAMSLVHLGREVTVSLRCEGCNNAAQVSRPLPLEGPFPPGSPPAASLGARPAKPGPALF